MIDELYNVLFVECVWMIEINYYSRKGRSVDEQLCSKVFLVIIVLLFCA